MTVRRPLRPSLVLSCALLAALPALAAPAAHASAATLSFTVTSTADAPDAHPGDGVCATAGGACTLRAAVDEANAQPSGSTISVSIPSGTYTLSLGQLTISRNVVALKGARAGQIFVVGQNSRLLSVSAGARVKVEGMTLKGGNAGTAQGGAVSNLGQLVLDHSAVINNNAQTGGGVYNGPSAGMLLVSTAVISNTSLRGVGGGIKNDGTLSASGSKVSGNVAAAGGGIANTGSMDVSGSSVSNNTAAASVGGGGIYNNNGVLTLSNSQIISNSGSNGGGIYNTLGTVAITKSQIISNSDTNVGGGIVNITGTVTLAQSGISGNTSAGGDGAGLYNTGTTSIVTSTITGNTATSGPSHDGDGGGVYNSMGSMTLTNATLSGNTANSGGGIFNRAVATLTNSTMSENTVTHTGGGIYSDGVGSQLTLNSSTVNANTAPFGGGAYNGSVMAVTNSTIVSNTGGYGAGINNLGTLSVQSSTFFGNANFALGNQYSGSAVLTDTILANGVSNCAGLMIASGGYNLEDTDTCEFTQTTDIVNTNPQLGPLADNGGPTQTMALLPGSPAIDHGGTAANGCPPTDQRGISRPQGPACDIGAFEVAL
jgi:CSLREA domain-containing protein